jgi:hypothetical protein
MFFGKEKSGEELKMNTPGRSVQAVLAVALAMSGGIAVAAADDAPAADSNGSYWLGETLVVVGQRPALRMKSQRPTS